MCNKPLYHYVKLSKQSLSLVYYHDAIIHTKDVFQNFILYCRDNLKIAEDGILVLESFYIIDWLSRMTAFYESKNIKISKKKRLELIQTELYSEEFQWVLIRVHKSNKISKVRYYSLVFKKFWVYYHLRRIYQYIK